MMKPLYLLIVATVLMCAFLPRAGFADVFFDDFDDDDISDWEWINKTDTSEVENGEVYMNSANIAQKLILLSPISVKNFTATYDMKVVHAPAGGLIFRYQDMDDYYFVHQGTAKLRLRRVQPDILGINRAQVVGQYITYKVVAEDDHFTVYIDDEELLDANDSGILEEGRIGFIVNSGADAGTLHHTYFDNFRVESDEVLLAVDAGGKLADTWGRIKTQH